VSQRKIDSPVNTTLSGLSCQDSFITSFQTTTKKRSLPTKLIYSPTKSFELWRVKTNLLLYKFTPPSPSKTGGKGNSMDNMSRGKTKKSRPEPGFSRSPSSDLFGWGRKF